MKKMSHLYLLSFSLLLSDAVYAADMGTSASRLPSAQVGTTPSWTAEEQAMGLELIGAAHGGNCKRIEEILAFNNSLANFKDNDGWTALMWAAQKGYIEIINKLIEASVEVNTQNKNGRTALMWAAQKGYTTIIERLISVDTNVNTQDNDGDTALMEAAHWGHTEIIERLLAAGAQVNKQDNADWSALMVAAHGGHTVTVQALLAARAQSTQTNSNKQTALQLAQENGHTNIVELLQNHVDIEPEEETLMVKPAVE